MYDRQVKITVQGYIALNAQHYLNRTSKNLGVLVQRTSEHFKIFLLLQKLVLFYDNGMFDL